VTPAVSSNNVDLQKLGLSPDHNCISASGYGEKVLLARYPVSMLSRLLPSLLEGDGERPRHLAEPSMKHWGPVRAIAIPSAMIRVVKLS